MFLTPKMHLLVTSTLYIIAFTTMIRIGIIILSVETGNVTMNNALREEMFDIMWFLVVAVIPCFLYKKEAVLQPISENNKQRIQSRG